MVLEDSEVEKGGFGPQSLKLGPHPPLVPKWPQTCYKKGILYFCTAGLIMFAIKVSFFIVICA